MLPVCVRDPQRGFPLHWVSTSLCLWPVSVCHSAFTRTDAKQTLVLTLKLSDMFSTSHVIYISAQIRNLFSEVVSEEVTVGLSYH